jgi:hypothetical protein
MTQLERIISKGQLVPFTFTQDNVAANQSAVDMNVGEVASAAALAITTQRVPFEFDVIAVTATLSAAGTTGTLTAEPEIDGTQTGLTVALTTGASGQSVQNRDKDKGAAGSVLSVRLTTTNDWDGTSSDLVVTVWALCYLNGV